LLLLLWFLFANFVQFHRASPAEESVITGRFATILPAEGRPHFVSFLPAVA
jgi:hypothetical protein